MRDTAILHDLLLNQCPGVHKKRLCSLMVAVQALLDGQQLSLTELGRNVAGEVEEAVFYIENGGLLDDIAHPNKSDYPHQRIFILRVRDYVYLVPYVDTEDELFLKTIIPSRKFTKKPLGGQL